jgi:hypothetical protein
MPDDDGHEWSQGCPDCAELRENLAEALSAVDIYRNELATLRAQMRESVVTYEARLRVEIERYEALLAKLAPPDPLDAYGTSEDRL